MSHPESSIVARPGYWMHDARRHAFRLFNRRSARRFRRMRERMKTDGYSLVPCDRYQCIFVRVPKCATRSIAKSLFGTYCGGHLTIDDYRLVYSAREFHSFFKFAFVRNPWDRLVSAYYFLHNGGLHDSDCKWYKENLGQYRDFGDFIRRWLTLENARQSLHFRPQNEFVCMPDGHVGVDFVAKVENISRDYETIAARLGLEACLEQLNVTQSRQRDYRAYYDQETMEMVSAVYARDIALFDYSFSYS